MKVYGWTARLRQAERKQLGLASWIIQCRCIIAERSKAEIGRRLGVDPRSLFNLGETGNQIEIDVALARPGVFFAAPLDGPVRPERFVAVSPEAVR